MAKTKLKKVEQLLALDIQKLKEQDQIRVKRIEADNFQYDQERTKKKEQIQQSNSKPVDYFTVVSKSSDKQVLPVGAIVLIDAKGRELIVNALRSTGEMISKGYDSTVTFIQNIGIKEQFANLKKAFPDIDFLLGENKHGVDKGPKIFVSSQQLGSLGFRPQPRPNGGKKHEDEQAYDYDYNRAASSFSSSRD